MGTAANRIGRRLAPALALGLLASVVVGCSRQAAVVLHQPFAPPSQQEMKLRSRWAFGVAASGRRSCLLELPRPGDAAGPRDFHIYLSLPDNEDEPVVARDDPGGVRGFLAQEVGLLRGKTEFSAGTVRCRRVFLQPRLRRLDLNVQCADGTSIVGKAYVAIDEREMRRFEREFAADIAALWADGAPSDERGETTAPRKPSPF